MPIQLARRQPQFDAGAAVVPVRRPYPAAVQIDDLATDGESEPGTAFGAAKACRLLELVEDAFAIFFGDARSVI